MPPVINTNLIEAIVFAYRAQEPAVDSESVWPATSVSLSVVMPNTDDADRRLRSFNIRGTVAELLEPFRGQ